jgi:hypothetical protein
MRQKPKPVGENPMTATRDESQLFSGAKINKKSTSVYETKLKTPFSRFVDSISTDGGDSP